MDGRKSPLSLCAREDGPTPMRRRLILSAKASISVAPSSNEGFAIALCMMGVGADILPADPAPPKTNPN